MFHWIKKGKKRKTIPVKDESQIDDLAANTGLVLNVGQIYKFKRKLFEGEVFLHETYDETTKSHLLALANSALPDKKNKKIFKSIMSDFFASYPASDASTPTEDRLASVNHSIKSQIKSYTDFKGQFSCALLEIDSKNLSVSSVGGINVFLARDKELKQISIANNQPGKDLFENFIHGEIKPGDSIIACTKTLLNFISLSKLSNILVNSSGQEAANGIMAAINKSVPTDVPILGFIFSIEADKKTGGSSIKISMPTIPRFKSLKDNKFLAITMATALVIFSAVLVVKSAVSKKAEIKRTSDFEILNQVDQELTTAEAALIYNDLDRVELIIEQVNEQLRSVYDPNEKDFEKSYTWTSLQKRLQELDRKINKLR